MCKTLTVGCTSDTHLSVPCYLRRQAKKKEKEERLAAEKAQKAQQRLDRKRATGNLPICIMTPEVDALQHILPEVVPEIYDPSNVCKDITGTWQLISSAIRVSSVLPPNPTPSSAA